MTLPAPHFKHGLVIGKFLPPHPGHLFLARTAALACESLTLGVLSPESPCLPLAVREAALRESLSFFTNIRFVHKIDDIPVDYNDESIWEGHVSLFKLAAAEALAREGKTLNSDPIDAVFTSEEYGSELARRLGCVHVLLDKSRMLEPFSGTAIREDPVAFWEMLERRVRQALCKRVVVVGAESTGTTGLARMLSQALKTRGGTWARTQWVPEFGREHTIAKVSLAAARSQSGTASMTDIEWTEEDFLLIAQMQSAWEEKAARDSGPVVICDTDALATMIWHERYRRYELPALSEIVARLPRRALYILTHHEGIPFEDDGFRDGENIRAWMTGRFEEVLDERGLPFITVHGSRERRLEQGLAAIDRVVQEGWKWV